MIGMLFRAQSDIQTAHLCLQNASDDFMVDTAAWHVQSAIEKTLKVVLQLHGELYPKTHDISLLASKVPEGTRYLPADIIELLEYRGPLLSSWAVGTRYEDSPVAKRKLVVDNLELAERMLGCVQGACDCNDRGTPRRLSDIPGIKLE